MLTRYLVEFRFKQVGRSTGDRLFIADRFFHGIGVQVARRTAIEALKVVTRLARDDLIALAGQDVECGLCAHDLA